MCSPAPTARARLKPIPCLWLVPNSEPEDLDPYPPWPKTSSASSATLSPSSSPRRRYQAYDALDLIDVDYEPLPAVVDPEAATKPGAPRASRRGARQRRVSLDGRRRRRRRRVQECRGRGPRSHHPAAADPDGDGAARRARAFRAGDRRADALEHHAEPAHRPLRRCRWSPACPKIGFASIAPEVGGGFGSKIAQIQGDFIAVFCSMKLGRPVKWTETRSENYHVDDARPRSRAGRRAGGDERRPHPRPALHGVGGHGRLSFDRGARHSRRSFTA